MMDATFFTTPMLWRKWLEKNHAKAAELWVGFHKIGSGKPSLTWPQAVEQALCFGWIDGLRKSIDETGYEIRFTPRKPKSIWSAVNLKKAAELMEQGMMFPAGLKAFQERDLKQSQKYSFEQKSVNLDAAQTKRLKENAQAWEFFRTQPPSYRKAAAWWVISAKQEKTRIGRMTSLISASETGRRLAHLQSPGKVKAAPPADKTGP